MASTVDYDLRLAARAIARYWWIVALVPVAALSIQLLQLRTAPYRAEFRAVVILPGDTELPGSSERPELMIMDDVPTLVGSALFTERVEAALPTLGTARESRLIETPLSATRYARTVTVVAYDDDRAVARSIASSAELVLGDVINEVLVADGAGEASVTIIDPTGAATRGEPDQGRVIAIVTIVMLFVGVLSALVIDGVRRAS